MTDQSPVCTDFTPYVDPSTGDALNLSDSHPPYLFSNSSSFQYPIINGIPRFIEDNNYAIAFGEQWKRWSKTQLDSHTSTSITRTRLLRCLGDELVDLLESSEHPLQVLEVGCGAGRFTEILLSFPNLYLTSLDISSAVDVNADNCPINNRHRIIQADINNPPFSSSSFDLVICLGVIQHTPTIRSTLASLYALLRVRGYLVLDCYTYDIRRLTKITANILRPIFKRLPSKYRIPFTTYLVNLFFPIHRAIRNIPFAQQIFSRISPITTYFHVYPELAEPLQREWSILDTHDGLTDWYKHLYSRSSLIKLLSAVGFNVISSSLAGNGIETLCQKSEL